MSPDSQPAVRAPVRTVFFGTAAIACPCLDALLTRPEFKLLAVVTQPDRPQGRSLRIQPPPVKTTALLHQLPVLQPLRAREPAFIEELRRLAPELIVVLAYGQILPQAILQLPRFGCVNVHTSLLPRHRGAAPIAWAIAEGDRETGVTLMLMDEGLDTGPILSQHRTLIAPEDTGATLHDRLALMGASALLETLLPWLDGKIQPQPQPQSGVTYARKITREDGRLDWTQSAERLAGRLRAFTPWPGAFTFLPAEPAPVLLKVWQTHPLPLQPNAPPGTILRASGEGIDVACAQGTLRLLQVQREGGRRLTAAQFLAGHSLTPGMQLGS